MYMQIYQEIPWSDYPILGASKLSFLGYNLKNTVSYKKNLACNSVTHQWKL